MKNINKSLKLFSVILAALCLSSPPKIFASTISKQPRNSAQSAWAEFRKAFLARNFNKLSSMVIFPVTLKGMLDDDPQFTVSEMRFQTCFSQIYTSDPGTEMKPTTHLQLIAEKRELDFRDQQQDDEFRVGNLQFTKKTDGYRLTRFYLDTSDPKVSKACR